LQSEQNILIDVDIVDSHPSLIKLQAGFKPKQNKKPCEVG